MLESMAWFKNGGALRAAIALFLTVICCACAAGAMQPNAWAADSSSSSSSGGAESQANAVLRAAELGMQASGVQVNAEDVTIYVITGTASNRIEALPEGKPGSFQLSVTGGENPVFRITSGRTVDVSADGLLTPHCTTWYWKGGMGTTAKPADMTGVTVKKSFDTGESTVTVYTSKGSVDVRVNVVDYGAEYFDAALDEYLAENVSDSMSVREKVEVACKYPASFPYSTGASSAYGMFYTQGGDCWASTDMIVRLCKKMGLNAWSRNGNKDSGAGSGHVNAMVEGENGTYYIAEAGYGYFSAPRPYDVTERTSLFSYRTASYADNTISVYQYDGQAWPETLTVPAEIDGKTVVALADNFASNGKFKHIELPASVTSIGAFAFSSCESLESFEIGPQVASVGDSAFVGCPSLKLTASEDNAYYSVADNVLYDKGKTKLLSAQIPSSVDIPDTVTEIGKGAFYYNYALRELTIPASVTAIDEFAFLRTGITTLTMKPKVAPVVSDPSTFTLGKSCTVRVPARSQGYDVEPWTNATVVPSTMADATVVLEESPVTYDGVEKTPAVVSVMLDGEPLVEGVDYEVSQYRDNVNAGTGKVVLSGLGDIKGTAQVEFTIAPMDISLAGVGLSQSSFVYDGAEAKPEVASVMVGSRELAAEEGIGVSYRNNVNAGTASAVVTGSGNYMGTATADFQIVPRTAEVRPADASKAYGDPDPSFMGEVTGLVHEGDLGDVTYSRAPEDVSRECAGDEVAITAAFDANPNYDVTVVPGKLTIGKRAARIVAADASKTYGDPDPSFAGDVLGLAAEGDLGEVAFARAESDMGREDVGDEVAIAAVYDANPNYDVEVVPGELSIIPATLVATYDGEEIEWDGAPACPITVTGFVNGEGPGTAAGYEAPTVAAPRSLEAGSTYSLAPAGGKADNYVFAYAAGRLVVKPKPQAVLDAEAAQAAEEAISGLPDSPALGQKGAVESARAVFDALTPAQKALVGAGFLNRLSACEKAIAALEEAAAEEEAAAAAKVGGKPAGEAERAIVSSMSDEGPADSAFGILQARSAKQTKSSITLAWARISGAQGYTVYANKCGKSCRFQKLADVGSTKLVAKEIAGQKVAKATYYKFIVTAWRMVDGHKVVLASSKSVHVATLGGKAGNYAKVRLAKKSAALKIGKTLKLKAVAKAKSKGATVKRHRKVAYETSNAEVASVNAKGIVKARSKGTCYLYAYAQNGVFAKCKVTVK